MTVVGARCLVVGAGGFIGANLTRALLVRGAEVVGLGRPPRYPPADHRWLDLPLDDPSALRNAIAGSRYVFHLLGSADPGASNRDPVSEARMTVPASLAVLDACRDNEVRRLVFLSSGGTVYRPGLPVPIDEDAPTDPISAYGIGKLMLEKYCALYRRLYGLDTVALRVANPFGPFQDPDRGQGFVAKVMKSALTDATIEIWGDGSVVRDFLYIDDLVDGIIAAVQRPLTDRIFNIGSGEGRSLKVVLDDVRRITGRETRVRHTPARASDAPANVLGIDRARTQLGWSPSTAWDDGLARTRDWIAGTL